MSDSKTNDKKHSRQQQPKILRKCYYLPHSYSI